MTNTTVVNAETMCAWVRTIAAGLVGPVAVGLGNAGYRRSKVVQASAAELSSARPYPPRLSPNRNRVGRLWRPRGRRSVYGQCRPNLAASNTAVEDAVCPPGTTYADALASLMTPNLQACGGASLLAA